MYNIKHSGNGLWVKDTGANFGLTTDQNNCHLFTEAKKDAFIDEYGNVWQAVEVVEQSAANTTPPADDKPKDPKGGN